MIARLLLFEVDDPLPAFERADIALVNGRLVAESLCRIASDQKNIAGNILMFVSR